MAHPQPCSHCTPGCLSGSDRVGSTIQQCHCSKNRSTAPVYHLHSAYSSNHGWRRPGQFSNPDRVLAWRHGVGLCSCNHRLPGICLEDRVQGGRRAGHWQFSLCYFRRGILRHRARRRTRQPDRGRSNIFCRCCAGLAGRNRGRQNDRAENR